MDDDALSVEEIDELLALYLGEDLRARADDEIPSYTDILNRESRCVVVQDMDAANACALSLRGEGEIAVDCEASVSMDRYGRLSVVQIGTIDGDCYLFDVFVGGARVLEPIRPMLCDARVTKVMHDCRSDSDLLLHQFDIELKNVVDTQVAFAVLVHSDAQQTPLPISLTTLHLKFGIAHFKQTKELARSEMQEDATYWERRPMSQLMVDYAAQDVKYLVQVYRKLKVMLTDPSIAQMRQYSQVYLDQYRAMPDQQRRDHIQAQSKSSAQRYIPKYGIEDWDFSAQRITYMNDLVSPSTSKRTSRQDDSMPDQLKKPRTKQSFFT